MKTSQKQKPEKSNNTEKIRKELPEGKEYDSVGRVVFKKGFSGNPAGKPEGSFSLLSILKAEIQKCPKGQNKKTYADLIVKRMLKESIEKGDYAQIKLIWNYIEGMPTQPITGTGKNGEIILKFDSSFEKNATPPKTEGNS